jgi:hypothetical protein
MLSNEKFTERSLKARDYMLAESLTLNVVASLGLRSTFSRVATEGYA